MEKLMIIDGNSLLYRGFYATPILTNDSGVYTNAVYAFTNILIRTIETHKPDYLVVAFDYGKKTFRTEMYPDYKGTRKETPPELISQFPLIKQVLKSMNICYIEKEGIEADDIIATISNRFKDLKKVIVTGDKDSFQLIDDNTNIYLTKKGTSDIKIINAEVLKNEYSLTPSQVVDLKSLLGDASDNIPGVRGVGEKTATQLINDYENLDNIYAHIDELKPKIKEYLTKDKDMAYLSYELAKSFIDDKLELNVNDFKFDFPFHEETRQIFKNLGFKTLIKKTSLFSSDKKVIINQKVQLIETNEDLQAFICEIKKQKEFAFCFDGNAFFVANDGFNCEIIINEMGLSGTFGFDDLIKRFKDVFEDESISKIVFDFKKVLYQFENYGINFKNIFDCAIAKYLLDSTIKNYKIEDLCEEFFPNEICLSLFEAKKAFLPEMEQLNLLRLFNEIEMPLCRVLYNMEKAGMKIDLNILKMCDEKFSNDIKECEHEIYELAGHEFNIKSASQVAKVLYEELGIKQALNAPKNSTSGEILAEIIYAHPIISLIMRYRRVLKLKNTYIDNYYKFEKNGYIHCEFNQTSTDTGRLSSTNPNLQNIPVRDSESKFIREVFVSRFNDGLIASFDYDQIELKLMAHLSNDETMIKAFNDGKDVHRITASMMYNVPEEEVTSEQRRSAKAVNFGMMYGQGPYGLSQTLGCPVKEANSFMQLYFSTFPGIKDYVTRSVQKAVDNDYTAVTIMGRRRKITELTVKNAHLRQFGERVAVNMPLQGTASDIIKIAMIKVNDMLIKGKFESKLILQIHDELVFDVKKDEYESLKVKVKEIMENVIKLQVPLTVSVSVGTNLLK